MVLLISPGKHQPGNLCYLNIMENPDHLILFDPYCNLCVAVVKYILKHDSQKLYTFGSLYSKQGKEMKKSLSWKKQKNTIIYFEGDEVYTQSDAAIQIISKLKGINRGILVFNILPKGLRDWGYKMIAKYRYTVFGKRKEPYLPSGKVRDRFLDELKQNTMRDISNVN